MYDEIVYGRTTALEEPASCYGLDLHIRESTNLILQSDQAIVIIMLATRYTSKKLTQRIS